MRIDDAFEMILNAHSVSEVCAFMDAITEETGHACWTYANFDRLPAGNGDVEPYYISTVKDAFERDYADLEGPIWDPAAHYALSYAGMFKWSELPQWQAAHENRFGRRVRGVKIMQLAFDHGMADGRVVPLKTLDVKGRRMNGLVTLFEDGKSKANESHPEIAGLLPTLIQMVNMRMCAIEPRLVGQPPLMPLLTDREHEVLRWAARGKTNEETGNILGCSARTVEKHLEHAMDKLGAANKAHAVALAITKGVISL